MVIRKIVLPLTVLSVMGWGVHAPEARAQTPNGQPIYSSNTLGYYNQGYYLATPRQHERQPNPTYWTRMPCPLHHNDPCDPCQNQHGMWTPPVVRWALDPNYYTVAPDYGWSEPGKWPIVRRSPVYTRYYPDAWYGTGKSNQQAQAYPVVGQPTDTTQLGYYYQTVPQWQPNPSMLPPPPHPRDWMYRPYELGPDGAYRKWVPLKNAWVPINQLGPQPMTGPGNIQPVPQAPMGSGQTPPPPVESVAPPQPNAAQPVPPPPPPPPPAPAAVEASVETDTGIRKVGFVQKIFGRK